jgi:cytochrome bd-type quinol oxidase subunit 1
MMAVMMAIMSMLSCFFFSSLNSWGPTPTTDPVQLGRPSEGSPMPNLRHRKNIANLGWAWLA